MHVCNACWRDVDEGNVYITRCGHQFCEHAQTPCSSLSTLSSSLSSPTDFFAPLAAPGNEDATSVVNSGMCAHCGAIVKDMKAVPANPPQDHGADALIGMSPDHIMRAACAAIDYWCAMREEVSREAHRRAADVAIRNEEGYKRKLCEIHSAYKRAKTKQNELWQHSQDLEADKKELQNKYEVKSREKNRIEAAMNDLLVHGIRGPEVVVPPPAENVLRRSISESYAASGLHRRDRDGNERLDSTFRTTEGGNSLDRSHGGGTTQNCRRWSSFSKPSLSRTHLEDHNRNPAGFRSGGRTIRPFTGFRENLGQQGSGGGNYASFRPQSPSRSIFSI